MALRGISTMTFKNLVFFYLHHILTNKCKTIFRASLKSGYLWRGNAIIVFFVSDLLQTVQSSWQNCILRVGESLGQWERAECDWIHCVQSGVNSRSWQKLLSEKRESSFCESTCGIVDIVSDTALALSHATPGFKPAHPDVSQWRLFSK